jgi:hypothetical protein
LDARRQEKDEEGDRDGPDAVSTPFEGLIQRVLGIVRVRSDEIPESAEKTAPVMMSVYVALVVVTGGVVKMLAVGF